jgi:hypothetical protein
LNRDLFVYWYDSGTKIDRSDRRNAAEGVSLDFNEFKGKKESHQYEFGMGK